MAISGQIQLSDFLQQLSAALVDWPSRKKYLVAVSGGRDSMALLFGLHLLGYRKLVVCHLNHYLRGVAAKADSLLAGRAAQKLELKFELGEADVKQHAVKGKLSLETAARDLRYAFFRSCARDHRCERIFLGHHADDQIETCLFNFLRGSGAAGLGGMKPVAHVHDLEILRPMLAITRDEITAFVAERRIPYREDRSNADVSHTRNMLRNRILPEIKRAFGASFGPSILRAAEILREEEAWMASLVPEGADALSCATLRDMPVALRRRVILGWLRRGRIEEVGFAETSLVLSLLDVTNGPAKVNLPGGRHARRRAGTIFLE